MNTTEGSASNHSTPAWVAYYAPLLEARLTARGWATTPQEVADFLLDVSIAVAEGCGLAAGDIDQVANRASLDAWADLFAEYLDDHQRDPEGIGPGITLDPDTFTYPPPPEVHTTESFAVEQMLHSPSITVRGDEYGPIVAGVAAVTSLYEEHVAAGMQRRAHALGGVDAEFDPAALQNPMITSRYSTPQYGAYLDQLDTRAQHLRACLTTLTCVQAATSGAVAGIGVPRDAVTAARALFAEFDDRTDLADLVSASGDPARWNVLPVTVALTTAALAQVCERNLPRA